MKKIIILSIFLLGGCSQFSTNWAGITQVVGRIENTKAPTLARVYELRAGYDAAFLAPAANYRRLGDCAAGIASTLAAPCAEPKIVAKLKAIDKQTVAALDSLETFTRNHPGDLGINGLYDAAKLVISQAMQVLSLTK